MFKIFNPENVEVDISSEKEFSKYIVRNERKSFALNIYIIGLPWWHSG